MALTETRPESEVSVTTVATPSSTLDSVLATGDHKLIGRMWIGAGTAFLLASLVVSAIAALEASDLSGFAIVDDAGQYVQLWSAGREALLFAGIAPILVGLATFITPLQVGSSSIAFPRGAAAAFWCWLVATLLLIVSYIDNGGPAGGRVDATVLWSLALAAMVGSIVWALVCVATTILGARAPGMSLERVPVSAWGFTVFSIVGIFALPIVMAQLLLAYLDTKYGYLPTADARGSLVTIGHSFSFAPTIYWIAVPTLGLAVEAIAVHVGRPVRFHRSVMASLGLLGIVAFTTELLAFAGRGRSVSPDNGLLVVALLVAILPALSVLGLVGDSVKTGKPRVGTPLVGGLLAGLLTLVGVIVGALGTIDPIIGFIEEVSGETINSSSALVLNGTAFHDGLRGIIVGAALIGIVVGVHHWAIKIWGRTLDDRLGLLTVLAAAAGAVTWGIGGVVAGFLEAPLIAVSPDVEDGVEAMNVISLVGIGLLAGAAGLLALNIVRAFAGRGSSAEPWRGLTLEWATDSPPVPGNFATMPSVRSATPLADIAATQEEQV